MNYGNVQISSVTDTNTQHCLYLQDPYLEDTSNKTCLTWKTGGLESCAMLNATDPCNLCSFFFFPAEKKLLPIQSGHICI